MIIKDMTRHASVDVLSRARFGWLACALEGQRYITPISFVGAGTGGANILRATVRVTFWGALAMALTAGVGKLFGTVV